MERKYLDDMKGTKCKIISKEPGEEKVKVFYGILNEIDYKYGFIVVKSRNGLGCLRIDNIVAIKPVNKDKKDRLILANKEAMVGIGTLIVFIAMILVAAVAASIIIQTSENLQQRAQSVSTQTIREVSSGMVINDVIGLTDINKTRITHLVLSVRPRAGSRDIDLSLCTVSVLYDELHLLTL